MSDENEQDLADDRPEYLYEVTLRIRHPTETLEAVSKAFNLTPDYKWQVGQPRTTPTGALLPGIHKHTYWACTERVSGNRNFFKTVTDFLGDLEAAQEFVTHLIASGGTLTIVIHLPGFRNIGAGISAPDLGRMARLGIELDVEVFPKMN